MHKLMKLRNAKFQNRNPRADQDSNRVQLNINNLLLSNPSIYIAIAEFTIHFRLINWRTPFQDQVLAQAAGISLYLSRIKQELININYSPSQNRLVIEFCWKLMRKIVGETELNGIWATKYIVDHYYRRENIGYTLLHGEFVRNLACYRHRFKQLMSKESGKQHVKKNQTGLEKKWDDYKRNPDDINFREATIDFLKDVPEKSIVKGKLFLNLVILLVIFATLASTLNLNPITNGLITAPIMFFLVSVEALWETYKPHEWIFSFKLKNTLPTFQAELMAEISEKLTLTKKTDKTASQYQVLVAKNNRLLR